MKKKLTLPESQPVDTFQLDRRLARELNRTSQSMGIPAEWIVEQALNSWNASAESDSLFNGETREEYVASARSGASCGVRAWKGAK